MRQRHLPKCDQRNLEVREELLPPPNSEKNIQKHKPSSIPILLKAEFLITKFIIRTYPQRKWGK